MYVTSDASWECPSRRLAPGFFPSQDNIHTRIHVYIGVGDASTRVDSSERKQSSFLSALSHSANNARALHTYKRARVPGRREGEAQRTERRTHRERTRSLYFSLSLSKERHREREQHKSIIHSRKCKQTKKHESRPLPLRKNARARMQERKLPPNRPTTTVAVSCPAERAYMRIQRTNFGF